MRFRLTTLIENHEDKAGRLTCEHGFSVLVEGKGFSLLMDTGQSGAFYENAGKLGLSLSGMDGVLLSHAHYDHTGGLLRLIKEEGLPETLYVGKHFFRKCYHRRSDGRMKYIGTKFDRQMLKDLGVPVEIIETDTYKLAEGVTLHRDFDHLTEYEEWNPDFFYQEEDPSCGPFGRYMDSLNYMPDHFEDEIALALELEGGRILTGPAEKQIGQVENRAGQVEDQTGRVENQAGQMKDQTGRVENQASHADGRTGIGQQGGKASGLFVVVGCSHPGIVNILSTIARRSGKQILGVIGGTHLVDADEDRVRRTAEDLKKLGVGFLGVSHCTGDQNIAILKDYFGDSFVFNCTGNVIELR